MTRDAKGKRVPPCPPHEWEYSAMPNGEPTRSCVKEGCGLHQIGEREFRYPTAVPEVAISALWIRYEDGVLQVLIECEEKWRLVAEYDLTGTDVRSRIIEAKRLRRAKIDPLTEGDSDE